jgi:hypothetical protein
MQEELRGLTVEQLIDRIKTINGILLDRKLKESELKELMSVAEEILGTCAEGMRQVSKSES